MTNFRPAPLHLNSTPPPFPSLFSPTPTSQMQVSPQPNHSETNIAPKILFSLIISQSQLLSKPTKLATVPETKPYIIFVSDLFVCRFGFSFR